MQLSEKELLEYNKKGLIPGPNEEESDFLKRAKFCLSLKKELHQKVEEQFAYTSEDENSEVLEEALPLTEKLFGIQPKWMPLFFSNMNLAPWHGACAWIFQLDEESPTASLMQLRKNFYHKKTYLWIYDRKELIAHELSHAGRMMFQEPKYEEIIAYRTSKSDMRRWFGPIIQSSKESMIFVILLVLIFGLDLFAMISNAPELYSQLLWLKAMPFILIGLATFRLGNRQQKFFTCLSRLIRAVRDVHKANAIIYRLTDKEIDSFAKMNPEEICEHAQQNKSQSLRWRLLSTYFSKNHSSGKQ